MYVFNRMHFHTGHKISEYIAYRLLHTFIRNWCSKKYENKEKERKIKQLQIHMNSISI